MSGHGAILIVTRLRRYGAVAILSALLCIYHLARRHCNGFRNSVQYCMLNRSDKHIVHSCSRAKYVLVCYDTKNLAQYHGLAPT